MTPDQDATPVPTEPAPPVQPSTLRWAFIGKDGLRAGWSLLIFVALVAAFAFCAKVVIHKLQLPSGPKPGEELPATFGLVAEGLNVFVALFVIWIMSKIERRPNSVYGLGGSHKLAQFLAGVVWGITCLSLLVLILWKGGLLVIDGRRLFGSDILRHGASWLFVFFLVGLFEEYFTRGYLLYTLTRGLSAIYERAFKMRDGRALGFWTSAVILSILFGLGHGHNPGESPIGLLSAGLASMVFAFSLWRTGSLWWAIGLHTSWDWGQSFLYGVADSGLMAQHHLLVTHPAGKPILSGGTTGPEGSVFILAILALISLIIFFTLPRAKNDGRST
jgi:membrane protease YdiL (CAAX protease family)